MQAPRCGRGAQALVAASRRAPDTACHRGQGLLRLLPCALTRVSFPSACRDCRSPSASAVVATGTGSQIQRSFHSSRRAGSEEGKDKDKERGKRLPSDDPSQLPGHFFRSASWFTPRKTSLNPIAGFFVRANTYALEKLSEGNFVQEEFLQGCRLSFEMVMRCFASGSVDDVAACMTDRMKKGFQQVELWHARRGGLRDGNGAAACAMAMAEIELGCNHMKRLMEMDVMQLQTLEEYKMQGLVLDYEIAPVDTAEIISIRFFVDELGNDRVHVDVEFEGKQRFTLRDCSNRAVGEEGDWQHKSSVWRFESPLPELKWELVDLP